MSALYDGLSQARKDMRERNDCAVVAVAAAAGLDYSYVHRLFKERGRRSRCVTHYPVTQKVLDHLGCETEDVTCMFNGLTVRQLAKRLPATGTYLIRTSRHILCAKDGEIHDWTEGRLHRVKRAVRLTVPKEPEPPPTAFKRVPLF